MTNTSTAPASTFTRGATACVIVCMLGGAVALSTAMTSTRESSEKRQTAESSYIETNGCVIAQMDGRFVAKYRCEKPEARYLSAAELSREATADAPVK